MIRIMTLKLKFKPFLLSIKEITAIVEWLLNWEIEELWLIIREFNVLWKVLGLTARIRRKRKYLHIKERLVWKQRISFNASLKQSKPMEKCYTDVTEFAIPNSTQKLYLSPVLDGFNSEIIAYNLSTSPNLETSESYVRTSLYRETLQKIQFSIVTRDGNINMISIIIF